MVRLLVVALGLAAAQVNAKFEVDVMGVKNAGTPDWLNPLLALAATTGETSGRKLGGHDNMSEEEQKELMKCMQACPQMTKMAQQMGSGGSPDMEVVCDFFGCMNSNAECAVVQKMMQSMGSEPAEGEDPNCGAAGRAKAMRSAISCICDTGCPVSSDMMEKPEPMCKSWDCWKGKDECKDMLAMDMSACPEEEEGGRGGGGDDSLGMARCICDSGASAKVQAMMGAGDLIGAPEGTCHDAKMGDKKNPVDESVDLCALAGSAPDGDCAELLVSGMEAAKGESDCKSMVEAVTKPWKDEVKKCYDDMVAAVDERKASEAATDSESSFAGKAALPSLAMLAIAGLLRA